MQPLPKQQCVYQVYDIFSRQAFLITSLHGAPSKTGENPCAKK